MLITRKFFFIVLAATGIAAVLLVLSLNTLVDKNRIRLREEIQKRVGREIAFDELRLSFWGGLGLSADNLRVAEDSRFAATPFLHARELKIHVRWLPLLLGRIVASKFTLEQPEIQIIRNEEGIFNLSALAHRVEEKAAEAARNRAQESGRSGLDFLVSAVSVNDGNIVYIDRSSREPVEIGVRRTNLDLWGIQRSGAMSVMLTAHLLDSPTQSIFIGGRVGPVHPTENWTEQPLEIQFRVDSLPLRPLVRAVPLLGDKVVEWGVAGPIHLQARLSGSLARPRLEDLNLSGSFFGAFEENTWLSGRADFSKTPSWSDGEIDGTLTVDPVQFDPLKKIAWLGRSLPRPLAAAGPLSIKADFQGSPAALEIRALVQGGRAEIRYGRWLNKARGIAARLELDMERRKDLLAFRESVLTLHNLKLKFSGTIEHFPDSRLTLRLQTGGISLAGWDRLIPPLASFHSDGTAAWDLAIRKPLGPGDSGVDIRGALKLEDGALRSRRTGRGIVRLTGLATFRGQDALLENVSMRLASAQIAARGLVPDLSRPSLRFSAHAPSLNPAEVASLSDRSAEEFRNLSATGELRLIDGAPALLGSFNTDEGKLRDIPYRRLRADIAWQPGRLTFRNLAFEALGGTFRADGSWRTEPGGGHRLSLAPEVESVDLNALLSRKFPRFEDHLDGRLDVKGEFQAAGANGVRFHETMTGRGESRIAGGAIRDFNMVEQVLAKIGRLPGISNLKKSRLPPHLSEILGRRNTPFEILETAFTIEKDRIRAEKVTLTAADYTIQGEGWIGFDKAMKWNAVLSLSPRFTRDLMREHRNVRYLVNRQGRFAVPFQLDGTLSELRAQPDMRALSETLRNNLLGEGRKRALENERGSRPNKRQP